LKNLDVTKVPGLISISVELAEGSPGGVIELEDADELSSGAPGETGTTGETYDLQCEKYDGYTDQCSVRKAWFCQYDAWRLNFFTVWLKDFVDYRNQYGSSLEMPQCSLTKDMVQCTHSEKKVCQESALANCPVCYCSDQDYKNYSQMTEVWRKDSKEWTRLMREWEAAAHDGASTNNQCGL
jgi:hypothetical protein